MKQLYLSASIARGHATGDELVQSAWINVRDLREVEKNSGFSFFKKATDWFVQTPGSTGNSYSPF